MRFSFSACPFHVLAHGQGSTSIIVVTGPGTEEYGQVFEDWNGKWKDAAEQSDSSFSS